MSKAVTPDGRPAGVTDARGVLLDLDIDDVDRLSRRQPGSAREYLERRREQLEAAKQKEAQQERDEQWMRNFISEGGAEKNAPAALQAKKNADAAAKADRLDREALEASRRRIKALY